MPLERIIAAAVDIIDEQGAEALSMRSLAQALGSGTATLYRHFDSRAELVAAVVDVVLGDLVLEPVSGDGASWREACENAANALFALFTHHPNIAPLLIDQIPSGPNAATGREYLIGALLKGGFSAADAAKTSATLSRFVLGFAIQAGGTHANDGPSTPSPAIDANAYPHTAAVADHLPVPLPEEFSFGLTLLLDGLTGLASPPQARRKK